MGIDIGTQSVRVGVCASDGRLLASAASAYQTRYPRPGWAEQDPRDWWRSICEASRECLRRGRIDPARIEGISFDATSSTVLMVDRDGEPLADAILWMDQRAVDEVDRITRTAHPILKYVGGQDSAEWMLPKSLWLKNNARGLFDSAWKILEATDWLAFKLCGQWTASLCNATCKWNYVSVEGGWSKDFFDALDARDVLSKWPERVTPIGERIGELTPEAASEIGLGGGIPVAEGGIDAHVGLLGLNALSPSRMGLIVGSSSVMFVLHDSPVYSPNFWGPYPDAILPGSWLVEAGQTSSGSIINWLVENLSLGREKGDADKGGLYSRLEEEAMALPPGCDGITMLDYWQGNRTPRRDPRAKGAIFGLTLAHDYRHLVRGAYEAIAYGTRHIVESLREAGIDVSAAAAGGGGTKSRIWLQLTADVCGMTISVPRYSDDCGVVGSAIAAARGAGLYGSLVEAAAAMVRDERTIEPIVDSRAFDEAYRRYLALYESTKALR